MSTYKVPLVALGPEGVKAPRPSVQWSLALLAEYDRIFCSVRPRREAGRHALRIVLLALDTGCGEFVRLALEESAAGYVDVARKPGRSGMPAMMTLLDGKRIKHPPFAPPFLKSGKLIIGQTANILLFLGART